jgi:hypothetical protein
MSAGGPMFALEGVDDKSYPYLRGIRALSQILQSSAYKRINEVYFSRPHICVVFNDYRKILTIDAAPTSHQTNERQNQQLTKLLNGEVEELDSTMANILVSSHASKITNLFIHRGSQKEDRFVLIGKAGLQYFSLFV